MRKNNASGLIVLIGVLLLCLVFLFVFNPERNTSDFRVSEDIDGDKTTEEDTTEYKEPYTDSYPYYGMREANLNNCRLGEPMIVSPCTDFDDRTAASKCKYYYFGFADSPNGGKIIVRYQMYDPQEKKYVDLPSDNGYVDSGYYIDEDGTEYDIDPEENSIVEEDTEETKEKKSGGRLLPASDDANDSDSGSSGKKKSTSATTEFDPDDHDIESYYEDNIDEFDSIDDAYDAFEDDEEAWDDY